MVGRLVLVVSVLAAGLFWLVALPLLDAAPGRTLPRVELDGSRPKPQGGFYRSALSEPESLNPFTSASSETRQFVLPYTHDALLEHDPDRPALRPALAVAPPEVELVDGVPSYTFELRDEIRFSDGSELTLDDVEFTVAAARAPGLPIGPLAQILTAVRAFERIGDRRFRVTLDHYHHAGEVELATQFRVVQRTWFDQRIAAVAKRLGLDRAPAIDTVEFARCLAEIRLPGPGTGPYRLHDGEDGWHRGVSLTMTQNPHCWRRTVYPECWNLAGIQLVFDPTLASSVFAALEGRVDWFISADLDRTWAEHAALRARYRFFTYDKMTPQMSLVIWNARRAPFDEPAVRRALSALFDREQILEHLHAGDGSLADGWFPPGSPDNAPDLEPIRFDPDGARDTLAAAGCREVEILTAPVPLFRRILSLARPAFERAGVELRVRYVGGPTLVTALRNGDFAGGVLYLQMHGAVVDPRARFHSSESTRFGGYANPDLDVLLDRASAEPDAGARRDLFWQISRILQRDQPVTTLVVPSVRVLLHRRFRGVQPNRLGLHPERWWVEPEDRIR